MSQFIVSARKYRPTRFADVVGQEHVTGTLKNALRQDKLAHSFLFCGPRGVGKTTCARILAKVLNCQQVGEDTEPCNTCPSCEALNHNASFNIIELDAASNNSVDHIRALIEQVRFQPQQGKYKVFIIDEVHMLSQQAFNAFLKTLEEPPPYAIFILATTEKHKIIPTILSRCQIFDFRRIQVPDMVAHLEGICAEEGISAEREALHIIAQKADGALRDALSIFDRVASFSGKQITYEAVIENLNVLDYDYYFRLTDALLTERLPEVLLTLDEVLRKGFDADLFINGLAEHFRQLLICQDAETLPLLEVSETLRRRYQEQASLVSPSFLLTALNLANDCDIEYRHARNKRLHVEMALIKMTYIHRASKPAPSLPEKKTPAPREQAVATKPPEPPRQPETSPREDENPKGDETPEPAKQDSGANRPKTDAPTPSRRGRRRNAITSLPNLGALEQDVRKETEHVKNERLEVTLDRAATFWAEYAAQCSQKVVRNHMQQAKLEVANDTIQVKVGSKLAKNTLREEMELMEYLRQAFKRKDLVLQVSIDKKLAKGKKNQTPKRLSSKEKFFKMEEGNPLIREACTRLGLTFDQAD